MKNQMTTMENDLMTGLVILWGVCNILFYPLICMFIDKSCVRRAIKDAFKLNYSWIKTNKS